MSELWREQVTKKRDPELEAINRLALARICQMEEDIRQRFGFSLRMGTELEMYLANKQGEIILAPTHKAGKSLVESPVKKGLANINLVERIYAEGKGSVEYTTGFKVPNSEKHGNARLSRENIRDQYSKDAHYRTPYYQAKLADRLRLYLAGKDYSNRINGNSVRFDGIEGKSTYTAAFQPSISVWKDNINLFHDKNKDSGYSDLAVMCAKGLLTIQSDTLLLGANYPESYGQYYNADGRGRRVLRVWHDMPRKEYALKSSILLRDGQTDHFTRVENRLPRADSNVVLAALQSAMGVYYALHEMASVEEYKPFLDSEYAYVPLQQKQWLKVPRNEYLSKTSVGDIGNHESNHEKLCNSDLAKKLMGDELHAKVVQYFSPEAIKLRGANGINART